MEEEQKEILDGVIIDLTKIGDLERELFAGSFEDILEKFPGNDKISFKWFTNHPSTEEPIMNILIVTSWLHHKNKRGLKRMLNYLKWNYTFTDNLNINLNYY